MKEVPILRNTAEGQAWLAQFRSDQIPYAEALLASLDLVPSDKFSQGFSSLVQETIDAISKCHQVQFGKLPNVPISFFAAREPEVKRKGPTSTRKPYFADKESRPNPMPPGGQGGSEGQLSAIVRNTLGSKVWLQLHPSLNSMISQRTRHICIFDDFIGSGKRCCEFVNWLMEDPTIKSWHSFGYIRFHVLAYAASSVGLSRLKNHKYIEEVNYVILARTWNSISQDESVVQQVRWLCNNVAKSHNLPMPEGFDQVATLTLFEHKCPNTTPSILYRESKTWKPLFMDRPEMGFSSWPEPRSERDNIAATLERINNIELDNTEILRSEPLLSKLVLRLACSARGLRKVHTLMGALQKSKWEVDFLTKECVRLGWLLESGRITDSGRKIVRRFYKKSKVKTTMPLTDQFYFPYTSARAKSV